MPSEIKAVIFDMGGVVIDQNKMFASAESRGIKLPDVMKTFQKLYHTEQYENLERGEGNLSDYCKVLAENLQPFVKTETGANLANDLVKLLSANNLAPLRQTPNPVLYQQMVDFVIELKAAGYKVALLTNNFYIDDRKDKSIILCPLDIFDVVVESCRVGMRKPERRIYEHITQLLDVTTDECVFLDDRQDNCEGAEVAGMKSIMVKHPDEAIADVKKLLQL